MCFRIVRQSTKKDNKITRFIKRWKGTKKMRLSIKLFLLCNQGYFKPKGAANCEKKITCLRSKLAEYKSTKVSEFFANINLHHNV